MITARKFLLLGTASLLSVFVLAGTGLAAETPVPLAISYAFDEEDKTLHAQFRNEGTAAITVLSDIELYKEGVKVGQKFEDNVVIAPGAVKEFSMTAPADLPQGNYRFAVAGFGPGWSQLYQWIDSAAAFTVGQAAGPKLSIVDNGQTWVSVRSSGADARVLVDLELYDSQGRRVMQKFFDRETIRQGETKTYHLGPAFLSPGNDPYVFKVGMFQPGWNGLISWHDRVEEFSIAH